MTNFFDSTIKLRFHKAKVAKKDFDDAKKQ